MRTRLLVGAVGLLGALYGGYLLVSRQDRDQLVSAATWLVAGVVLHDLVLAPLVLLVVVVAARLLPHGLRAGAVAGLVVLGTVTLAAVPVLGRFGARPDNPSLLDRNYLVGWGVLATLVVLVLATRELARRWTRN